MIRVCSFWSSENVQYKNANWTWEQCQLVQELAECLIWGSANVKWGDARQHWGGCDICYTWGNAGYLWSGANWVWSRCKEPFRPAPPPVVGVDATVLIQPWLNPEEEQPWNPYKEQEKRKKLIELICKVKGKEFNEKTYAKDIQVTVRDVKLAIKTIANIDLDIINSDNVHSLHR